MDQRPARAPAAWGAAHLRCTSMSAQGIRPPVHVCVHVCHVFRPPTQPVSSQGWLALMCSSNTVGLQPQQFTLTDSMLDLVALMNSSCGPGTLLEGDPAPVASPLGTSASRSVPKASQQGSASRLTSEPWLPAACWCLFCEALSKFSACSGGIPSQQYTDDSAELQSLSEAGHGRTAALQGQLGAVPTPAAAEWWPAALPPWPAAWPPAASASPPRAPQSCLPPSPPLQPGDSPAQSAAAPGRWVSLLQSADWLAPAAGRVPGQWCRCCAQPRSGQLILGWCHWAWTTAQPPQQGLQAAGGLKACQIRHDLMQQHNIQQVCCRDCKSLLSRDCRQDDPATPREVPDAVLFTTLQALSRARMFMLAEHCQQPSSQLHPQLYRQLAAPAGEACDAGGDWRTTLR